MLDDFEQKLKQLQPSELSPDVELQTMYRCGWEAALSSFRDPQSSESSELAAPAASQPEMTRARNGWLPFAQGLTIGTAAMWLFTLIVPNLAIGVVPADAPFPGPTDGIAQIPSHPQSGGPAKAPFIGPFDPNHSVISDRLETSNSTPKASELVNNSQDPSQELPATLPEGDSGIRPSGALVFQPFSQLPFAFSSTVTQPLVPPKSQEAQETSFDALSEIAQVRWSRLVSTTNQRAMGDSRRIPDHLPDPLEENFNASPSVGNLLLDLSRQELF